MIYNRLTSNPIFSLSARRMKKIQKPHGSIDPRARVDHRLDHLNLRPWLFGNRMAEGRSRIYAPLRKRHAPLLVHTSRAAVVLKLCRIIIIESIFWIWIEKRSFSVVGFFDIWCNTRFFRWVFYLFFFWVLVFLLCLWRENLIRLLFYWIHGKNIINSPCNSIFLKCKYYV